MSSTVQFFRISPNLLPENRPSTSPPRSRARMRLRDFRDHRVGDIEAEGIVDAGEMVDADQHEGAGRAEAGAFLDRLGQRSDQVGAVEFAGQRIVPRQFQQLLVAGVALIVDAHDALRARRPAVGAGEPAAGFLDPDHRRRCRDAHAIFDPVGGAFAAARRRGLAERVGADGAGGLDQLCEFRAARERFRRDIGKHGSRVVAPGDARRSRCPRRKSPARARPGCWRLAERKASDSPRFGTRPG